MGEKFQVNIKVETGNKERDKFVHKCLVNNLSYNETLNYFMEAFTKGIFLLYRVNINYDPNPESDEKPLKPKWKIFTKREWLEEYKLTNDDWNEMIEAGVIKEL